MVAEPTSCLRKDRLAEIIDFKLRSQIKMPAAQCLRAMHAKTIILQITPLNAITISAMTEGAIPMKTGTGMFVKVIPPQPRITPAELQVNLGHESLFIDWGDLRQSNESLSLT